MNDSGYENKLKAEFGVDLHVMRGAIGHPGGVHGDNMYLFAKLMSLPQITDVLEFGSGLSSLVFGYLAAQTSTNVVTLEEWPKWTNIANKALENLNIEHRVYCTRVDPKHCPVFDKDFQLVFVDGGIFSREPWDDKPNTQGNFTSKEDYVAAPESVSPGLFGRPGACFFYKECISNAIHVWDDAEFLEHDIRKTSKILGRNPDAIIWFNPTGRAHRHQAISLPEQNKDTYFRVIEEVANL